MVERLYPGVYVTEVASQVKPIEGVATATAPMAPLHARLPEHTPAWTNHNDSDPGGTLLQTFAWLSELTLFGASPNPAGRRVHAPEGWGIAQGLAIEDRGPDSSGLRVLPGFALSRDGQPLEAESTTVALRVKKP